MTKTIFTRLAKINHDYLEELEEATALGFETAGTLADEYCQFLVDASKGLQLTARDLEHLATKNPDAKAQISQVAQLFRDSAQAYAENYASFERLQRAGKIPTSFKTENEMTEDLE